MHSMNTSNPIAESRPDVAQDTTASGQGYTALAKGLHWLMAAMIFGLLGLGIYMTDLPLSPEKLQLYSWHKWAGVSFFMLVWIRLLWRLSHRPPALPPHMSDLQQRLAHLGHAALYGLMFAIPISGWLMSSAKGFQTVWFGVIPLPDLLARDRELGDALAWVHKLLNLSMIVLVIGHIAVAVKHHVKDKDDVLRRMVWGRARPRESASSETTPPHTSESSL